MVGRGDDSLSLYSQQSARSGKVDDGSLLVVRQRYTNQCLTFPAREQHHISLKLTLNPRVTSYDPRSVTSFPLLIGTKVAFLPSFVLFFILSHSLFFLPDGAQCRSKEAVPL